MIQRSLADGRQPTADSVRHWESQAARLFADEVTYHFAAEEAVLFPAAEQHDALRPLVAELRAEHTTLRAAVLAAAEHRLGADGLRSLASTLSNHVRKEER